VWGGNVSDDIGRKLEVWAETFEQNMAFMRDDKGNMPLGDNTISIMLRAASARIHELEAERMSRAQIEEIILALRQDAETIEAIVDLRGGDTVSLVFQRTIVARRALADRLAAGLYGAPT